MFKIDDKSALVLLNDISDVYKVAKAFSDIDELAVETDKDSSEFFNLVFAKDNSRVIVADRQKLKEVFIKKTLIKKILENHPEILEDVAEKKVLRELPLDQILKKYPEISKDDVDSAEEEANYRIQDIEGTWDMDFDVNLGPNSGGLKEEDSEGEIEEEDSEEEGLASEEEVSQIEQQLEQESEAEEETGLLDFADEIKTMYDQGAGVRLLHKPSGKNLTIIEVKDTGIVVKDDNDGKKGLLSNDVLNARSDQFEIL
jgi:hypothetical protein